MVKLGIILFLVFIVYNLAAGCYHMLTNKDGSDKVVRSLSWRIGLSILLIILIMLGIKFGIIVPHDVLERPRT